MEVLETSTGRDLAVEVPFSFLRKVEEQLLFSVVRGKAC